MTIYYALDKKNYTQKSFFWYSIIPEEIVISEFLDPISLINSQSEVQRLPEEQDAQL